MMDDELVHSSTLAACGKSHSESFDIAQDERGPMDIIRSFPFMLSSSKRSEAVLATC